MRPLGWMVAACMSSWIAITTLAPAPVNPELLWGMIGPLLSAALTWIAVVRTHRTARERVTGVLVAGFALKIVFFGVYLAVMLRVVGLRVVPFALTFVGYVIGLYVIEALFLRRLFVDGMRPSPGA